MKASVKGRSNGRFRQPVYVLFFALMPVLSLLSANTYQMALIEGLRAAVLVVGTAGALFLLLGLRTGQWHRAALVTSLFLLFFLSYGYLYQFFLAFSDADNKDRTYTIASISSLSGLGAMLGTVWFRLKRPERLALNLNIVSLVLLILPSVNLTSGYLENRRSAEPTILIRTLLSQGLIEEIGRMESPSRPILYGTTPEFLQHFGLGSIDELPPIDPLPDDS